MSCPGFHPHHQAQLEYRWGGEDGGSNCTACAAGMVAEVDQCGALLLTGDQIRDASNEPVPDPRSPGLNLGQVDTSVYKLSKGKVNLDVHYRYDFEACWIRVERGEPAVVQFRRKVFVDRGYALGNLFGGGHAGAMGFDGRVWLEDPLTKRFYPDKGTMKLATGSLVLGSSGEICGIGKVYVAFGRDVIPNYRVRFYPGAAFIYTLRDGKLWSRKSTRFTNPAGTGAPCAAPRRYYAHPSGPLAGTASRRLAVITAGFLKGKAVGEKLAVVDIIEVP